MTWLIAEDELDIRMLIAMMCQVWGHQALLFENGQKVWDWLDEVERGSYSGQLPQLALMDIRMPGKKGNELAQRMRKIPALGDVPIVLMTAFALNDAERGEIIRSDGVDHIISKPLPDFEELRTLLHNVQHQTDSSPQVNEAHDPEPATQPSGDRRRLQPDQPARNGDGANVQPTLSGAGAQIPSA